MIDIKDVMPISFLKKEPFTGSFQGMRYRIEKAEVSLEDTSEENNDTETKKPSETETVLKTFIWPQPFCFDKTPDEQKSEKNFEFTSEGLSQAVDWLNERYIKEKKRWTRE